MELKLSELVIPSKNFDFLLPSESEFENLQVIIRNVPEIKDKGRKGVCYLTSLAQGQAMFGGLICTCAAHDIAGIHLVTWKEKVITTFGVLFLHIK